MRTIELINLTLNEIRRSAQVISDVMNEQEMILKLEHQLGERAKDVLVDSIMSKIHALEKCQESLRNVLEDIAEFQNDRALVRGVDSALGQVAYDLIYERTTAEDYEPKDKED